MLKSNKLISLMLLSLAIVLVLGACGQNSNNGGKNAGSPNNEAAAVTTDNANAGGDGETVIFPAANGDIEVPKNPQRIVDATAFNTGYFLALGIKPVGIMEDAMANPYFEGMLGGVTSLGNAPTPENILALDPDLIIVYTGTEGIDKLEEIAPVVAIEYGKKTYKEQMIEFGKLTNKDAEAKAWIEQWEKQIAELKPKVQEAVGDKTVSILNPYSKGLYVFGHNFGRGGEIIYGEFGLKAPAEAQKQAINSGTGWASISLETIPQFAGDIIFTCPWSGDDADPSAVYDNAIWTGLPAVKAGNVFQLNPAADTYNDPVSLEAQLTFISESLLSVK
ncbi:ABC transporter substrate-binding protein [Paenibacillus sp. LHD-117]|uniref:ABC transporter substrate-binding protein n=1 Tax=Paenibacillus sp. LHD-117 TaxID=3071412 RepID=UPI0027E014F7|nr:ABC transporter substrate-binding protein [Paenibacillus sp. LHD-117]MDQ6422825.1 ABC transporter substrate-binding protein [Paenibacillus sp. LHD-117]